MEKLTQVYKNRRVKRPYRGRESALFALWLSMPFVLHELPTEKLSSMGYDVEDEEFIALVKCRTRTAFSTLVGVTRQQLTTWEKSEPIQKMVSDFNMQGNVLRFKKDVDYHFTQKAIREGDAPRVKLWKQLFEGWQERSQVSDPARAEAIREQTLVLRKLAGRK